jgi:flagellin
MVINTNIEALQNANNLNASATGLAKSLARLSSGSKIVTPSDDAAGLAVSSRLQSQIARLDSALSNVVNAVSLTQTQDGFMKTIDKALSRMGELAMLAQDTTKSTQDLALYNQEFTQLQDYISVTALKTYNSVTLFSSTSFNVTIDSSGNTFALNGTDITGSTSYTNAISTGTSIATATLARTALTYVLTATSQVAQDRARLGAYQARLNFTSDQLIVTKENLAAAVSRITDTDVAEESTRYARNQILVQSGTTMLTQANSLPQSALRLLQG